MSYPQVGVLTCIEDDDRMGVGSLKSILSRL